MTQIKKEEYLDELLAPYIARVELDGRKSLKFRAEMGAGCFADPRRARDHDTAEHVHTILTRLFESRFQIVWPVSRVNYKREWMA